MILLININVPPPSGYFYKSANYFPNTNFIRKMKTTKLFYFIFTFFVVWVTESQCTLVSNEIHYTTRSFKYMPVSLRLIIAA